MFYDIINYIKSDRRSIRSMLIFTFASSLLIISIPFLIQTLIQQFTLLVFQYSTVFLILTITLFLSGITILRIFQMHLSEYFQRRLFLRSIEDARKSAEISLKSNQPFSPKKWNYIFESISLQKSIISLFFEGSTFALQSFLVISLISIYHPFFVIYSLILAFAFYFVVIVMGKKTLEYSLLESNKKHELIYTLQTKIEDLSEKSKIDEKILDYYSTRETRYSHYIKQSIGLLIIKIIAAVLLLVIGGLLVFQNQMTIGQLIASELIVTNLLISLFKFSNILDYYYDSAAAVKKLQLLQEEH